MMENLNRNAELFRAGKLCIVAVKKENLYKLDALLKQTHPEDISIFKYRNNMASAMEYYTISDGNRYIFTDKPSVPCEHIDNMFVDVSKVGQRRDDTSLWNIFLVFACFLALEVIAMVLLFTIFFN